MSMVLPPWIGWPKSLDSRRQLASCLPMAGCHTEKCRLATDSSCWPVRRRTMRVPSAIAATARLPLHGPHCHGPLMGFSSMLMTLMSTMRGLRPQEPSSCLNRRTGRRRADIELRISKDIDGCSCHETSRRAIHNRNGSKMRCGLTDHTLSCAAKAHAPAPLRRGGCRRAVSIRADTICSHRDAQQVLFGRGASTPDRSRAMTASAWS
jgi:hypothetical protein